MLIDKKEKAFETAKEINYIERANQPEPEHFSLKQLASLEVEDLFKIMNTSPEGLTNSEAIKRLRKAGINDVSHEKNRRWYFHLLNAFNTPFNLLLLLLAVVSYFTRDLRAVVLLFLMVLLSSLLRFVQEYKSGKAAEKLKALIGTFATVKRKTSPKQTESKKEVDIKRLVPGDIIFLSSGDMIPADVRVLSSKDLFVSQATLTGESFPVEKEAKVVSQSIDTPLDYPNLCFMGSNIVSGTGMAMVLFTGKNTFLGSISHTIARHKEQTDFDVGINKFSWLLIRFMMVMVPIVFLINGLLKGNWVQALLFAIAIAVGLTPEMLPMVVTANLAKGAVNMSRKKVIVKKLKAIQNFGAINILCTDKTGTLTQDKVVLIQHVDVNGKNSDEVLKHAYLNSHFQTGLKNLMDISILEHVELQNTLKVSSDYKMIDEIPFDFERRRMSVIIEESQHHYELICKGALEEMFEVCSKVKIDGEIIPLDSSLLSHLHLFTKTLNETGFRVIAIAYKEMALTQKIYSVKDEKELILLGFVAFLDPPKDSAAPAIKALKESGISVKILTGDNDIVTRKICTAVGIEAGRIVLGSELTHMNQKELEDTAQENTVFAKLSPDQKEILVKALRCRGNVVGFMGDGINDSPALRAADIGVSVDSAVDIAKESADIILLEKSLMVIKDGVIEGRKTFGNTVKYIMMASSSNFGNMFSMLGASALLPFLPMLPVQILIQNLLYDFSQTAIPFDKVDEDYTEKPRRWQVGSIEKFMIFLGPVSSIFDYCTFGLMWYIFKAQTISSEAVFHTGWFIEGLLSQTLIVHIIRTSKIPFFQSTGSLQLYITTAIVIFIGLYLPYSPFGSYLGFTPLPLLYFIWLTGILLAYSLLTQLVKSWFISKYGFI